MEILEPKKAIAEILKAQCMGSTPEWEDRGKNQLTKRQNNRNYTVWTTERKMNWKQLTEP